LEEGGEKNQFQERGEKKEEQAPRTVPYIQPLKFSLSPTKLKQTMNGEWGG